MLTCCEHSNLETSTWNIKTLEPFLWPGASDFWLRYKPGTCEDPVTAHRELISVQIIITCNEAISFYNRWKCRPARQCLCFQIPVWKWEERSWRGTEKVTSAVPFCHGVRMLGAPLLFSYLGRNQNERDTSANSQRCSSSCLTWWLSGLTTRSGCPQ